jgi:NAD(P)-dependent dehydrogenase (short-subunit alcohol dehydrogenase family)
MFARRRDLLEREAERIGALAVRGDLTVPTDLERLVETTVDAFGGIDVLVNNGGARPPDPLRASPTRRSRARSSCSCSRDPLTNLCLPYLETSGRGRIVNIESSSVPPAHRQPCAVERAPARGRRLDEDARPGGRTERDHREHDRAGPHRHRASASLSGSCGAPIPLGRVGEPAEIAGRRLLPRLRPRGYVTGAVLPVDGGLTRNLL